MLKNLSYYKQNKGQQSAKEKHSGDRYKDPYIALYNIYVAWQMPQPVKPVSCKIEYEAGNNN